MSSLRDVLGRAVASTPLRKWLGLIILGVVVGGTAIEAAVDHDALTASFTVPFYRGETPATGADAIEAEAASMLRGYPRLRARVVGYTEPGGDSVADVGLSERRAFVVRDALQDSGIAADRITAFGLGSDKPLTRLPDDTDASYAHRLARVEIALERK